MKDTIVDLINKFKLSKGLLRDSPEIADKIEEILRKVADDDDDDLDELDFEDRGFDDEDEDDLEYSDEDEDLGEGFSYFSEDDPEFADEDEEFEPKETKAEPEKKAPAEVKEGEKPKRAKQTGRYREWGPKDKYEPHHEEAINKFVEQGYSHREAEAMAGAHEPPESFEAAFRHPIKASEPSDKFLTELKDLAGHWLEGVSKHKAKQAQKHENPELYGAGQVIEAKEKTRAHKDAYKEFLKSPELEGLGRSERMKAIREWKGNYAKENPGHRQQSLRAVGEASGAFKEARQARKQSVEERLSDILGSLKSSPDVESMTSQAAAQHVGGAKEEGGYTSGIERDPLSVFAAENPAFLEHHQKVKSFTGKNEDAARRLKEINTAKAAVKPKIEGEE